VAWNDKKTTSAKSRSKRSRNISWNLSAYPLDRRLGRPQSQSGRRGEEKSLDPTGTRTPTTRSSSP
jgi:hypothetical protein